MDSIGYVAALRFSQARNNMTDPLSYRCTYWNVWFIFFAIVSPFLTLS